MNSERVFAAGLAPRCEDRRRAATRARSRAEFVAKLGIVLEEADEALYWMELLVDTNLVKKERLRLLLEEANELTAITVASIKTAKRGRA